MVDVLVSSSSVWASLRDMFAPKSIMATGRATFKHGVSSAEL
jgi:hypothetical protein